MTRFDQMLPPETSYWHLTKKPKKAVFGPIFGPDCAHEAKTCQNDSDFMPVHHVESEKDKSKYKIARK